MKYNIIIGVMLIASYSSIAQEVTTTQEVTVTTTGSELTSKRGTPILPIADEWGLGVSADPFFNYLGNFFNGNDDNESPGFNLANDGFALHGKKMLDANTAYRARLNVAVGTDTDKRITIQDDINFDPNFPAFTQDWRTRNFTNIVLAAGIEKRRGVSRLQGVYGAELVLAYGSGKYVYEYGNAISADFPQPNASTLADVITSVGPGQNLTGYYRVTENVQGKSLGIGARGFVGVEYFFAPKISIGAEFGYTLGYNSTGTGKLTAETWDATTNSVRTIDVDQAGGSSYIGLELDDLSGFINLLFYF